MDMYELIPAAAIRLAHEYTLGEHARGRMCICDGDEKFAIDKRQRRFDALLGRGACWNVCWTDPNFGFKRGIKLFTAPAPEACAWTVSSLASDGSSIFSARRTARIPLCPPSASPTIGSFPACSMANESCARAASQSTMGSFFVMGAVWLEWIGHPGA